MAGLLHRETDVTSEAQAEAMLKYTEDSLLCVGIGGTNEFQLLKLKDFKGITSGQQLFSSHYNGSALLGI